jgi:uncharacterized protein YbaP (TraB family)
MILSLKMIFSRMHSLGVFAAFFLLVSANSFAQKTSLLWEIQKDGTKEVSFLYGTMHSQDVAIFKHQDAIFNYVDKCTVFSGELDMNIEHDPMAMSMQMMAKEPLSKWYSEEDLAILDAYLTEKLGEMAPVIMMFKPFWIMATLIQMEEGLIDSEETEGEASAVIDDQLQRHAESKGLKISALETIQEQMDAINGISMEEQAEMLLDVAKEPESQADITEALKAAYIAGDLDQMYEVYLDESLSTNIERLLIDVRNMRMANRLAASIEEGNVVFCAIGALHLPGEEGVIERLRTMGYNVKAVKY